MVAILWHHSLDAFAETAKNAPGDKESMTMPMTTTMKFQPLNCLQIQVAESVGNAIKEGPDKRI